MPKNLVFSRAIYASGLVLVASALGGCSSGSGGSGGTSLDAALSQVASTSSTRSQIAYDNTAELVRLSGTSPATTKGFAVLRGLGASSLAPYLALLASDTGINLLKEDYAITAGNPPQMVTLLHGGQSGSLVTSRLSKLGWKSNGGTLTGPSIRWRRLAEGVALRAAVARSPDHRLRRDVRRIPGRPQSGRLAARRARSPAIP